MSGLPSYDRPSAERHQARLGISREAAELFHESDVIDLHVESFSFYRAFGYHPGKRHSGGLHRALIVGQADLPRLVETGINGATWVFTANPLREQRDRALAFSQGMSELTKLLGSADGAAAIVRNESEYRAAVSQGKHACFLGVQGANAFPTDPESLDAHGNDLIRITLMHLTPSAWGQSSLPGLRARGSGLGNAGYSFVEKMNELRIGVDLAHIDKKGFWDAVRASDKTQPLLVSHTGVSGAHEHWRNVDDDQLRAIAQSGGTVGIMYHSVYLGDPLFSGKLSSVVRHLVHALKVVGPDHVSLGSDWDGAICTPRDMPTCSELPKLVDALLKARVAPETIQKVLGENFLRVVRELKGTGK